MHELCIGEQEGRMRTPWAEGGGGAGPPGSTGAQMQISPYGEKGKCGEIDQGGTSPIRPGAYKRRSY